MSGRRRKWPGSALDLALRKDLGKFQTEIATLELVRFQGPYPRRRHGRGHPCTGRKPRRHRRALDHHRRQRKHHRRLIEALYESITYKLLKDKGDGRVVVPYHRGRSFGRGARRCILVVDARSRLRDVPRRGARSSPVPPSSIAPACPASSARASTKRLSGTGLVHEAPAPAPTVVANVSSEPADARRPGPPGAAAAHP